MYATTMYNFVRLKATHKISPLEELVGGRYPPSSSQRLTGMHIRGHFIIRLDGFTSNIYVIFTVLPDSMGSNGDQYFNATFSSEPPVSDFQPFNVS
jgi:hypothetical protein